MLKEDLKTVERMEKYGGSFVKALAACCYTADLINYAKLKTAFSNYFEEFKIKDND